MFRRKTTWTVAATFLLISAAQAQVLNSVRVGTGFTKPIFATSAPGDPTTLYVVEQGGLIRTLNPNTGSVGATPFLNLPGVAGANLVSGGEQGLLGFAFHPDYSAATGNGHIFVDYTTTGGALRVDRFQVTGGTVNTGSRTTMLTWAHPSFTNHNGGWIGFNPTATGSNRGYLYISSGDGGDSNDPNNNAQNTNSLLGKMLRIDVLNASSSTYSIPSSNPFASGGGAPQVYYTGLRNPWRNSFDRSLGNLFIADVGQGAWEEINYVAAGRPGGLNFGWRDFEGNHDNPGVSGTGDPTGKEFPIHEYSHSVGQSITGGYVYRGPNIIDGGQPLDGTYFFADYISGRMFSFRYDGTTLTGLTERTSQLQNAVGGGTLSSISSFAEDGFGNLFVIDYGGLGGTAGAGEIYRIAGVPEPGTLALTGLALAGGLWRLRRRRTSVAKS